MNDAEWIAAGYTDWPHFVRVECDYGADGVWNERGAAYNIDDFAIPQKLKDEFRVWQHAHDETAPDRLWDMLEKMRYTETALRLSQQLKRALPNCLVVFIDRRIDDHLNPCERVPWPGEGWEEGKKGQPFREWKAALFSGQFEP